MAIKILVVDDHPVFLAGIIAVLKNEPNLNIVGTAENGEVAIQKAKELQPDIVIMDISMPGIDGIEATKQILEKSEKIKVLALSIHTGKRFVKAMLNAGASGYLPKDVAADEIVTAIDQISKGNMYLSPSITSVALSASSEPMEDFNANVLKTKLYRPPVMIDFVIRKNIIEKLELNREKPLSLITAPAGYGKSVTVSEWLENTKALNVWISLDEEHNQLRVFLQYMITALEHIFPGTFIETGKLIKANELPSIQIIALTLINELDLVKHDFILVLDDYHAITNESIHKLISEILQYPLEHMHLSIITRRDPPLALQRLRMNGWLVDVRMKDLSFSELEVKELFFKLHNIELSDTAAHSLIDKTEGWIVGIRMAILSINNAEEANKLFADFSGNIHDLTEFILEEVLNKQTPEVQELLIISSLFNRFCSGLINELILHLEKEMTIIKEGNDFISWIISSNLFVIPLDENRNWFRYHHFFQDLLQAQLKKRKSETEIKRIHQIAANWFEKRLFIDEAMDHALFAGDKKLAAEILIKSRIKLQGQDSWQILQKCLLKLPEDIINSTPELLIIKAWISFNRLEFQEIAVCVDKIEKLDSNENIEGEVDFFKGYFCYFQAMAEESERLMKSAANKISVNKPKSLGEAELHYGLALHLNNKKPEAINYINSRLALPTATNEIRRTRLYASLFFIHLLDANLHKVIFPSKQVQEIGLKNNYLYASGWGKYTEALVLFNQGECIKAGEIFEDILKNTLSLHSRLVVDSFSGYILCLLFTGQENELVKVLTRFEKFCENTSDASAKLVLLSFRARLALQKGDVELATRFLNKADLSADLGLMLWWIEVPRITQCRVFIAEGTPEKLTQAIERLTEIYNENHTVHNTCQKISILALLAVACDKLGQKNQALEHLKQCIKLGHQGEWILSFFEYPEITTELLNQIAQSNTNKSYIGKIMATIKHYDKRANESFRYDREIEIKTKSEPISHRQYEIVQLVAEGFRNKEIADKLFISENTVKKHLYNIFQNYDVKNRISLVEKAKELGLFENQ